MAARCLCGAVRYRASGGVGDPSCDEPEAFPPADHVFASHGISWMQADDGLQRHRESRKRG